MFTKSATYKRESFVIRFLKRSLHEEMPQLGEFNKDRMIGMLEASLSIIKVARKITCCKRTVKKLWQRLREDSDAKRKSGSGRPRVTHARQDERLVLAGKRDRFSSMRVIYSWYPGRPTSGIYS